MVCFDWPLCCLQNSYMLFSPSLKMLNRTYHVVCFAFSDFANLCKNDMLKNNELVSGLINTPLSHHSSLSIQDRESKTLYQDYPCINKQVPTVRHTLSQIFVSQSGSNQVA